MFCKFCSVGHDPNPFTTLNNPKSYFFPDLCYTVCGLLLVKSAHISKHNYL